MSLNDWFLAHETSIRLGSFVIILAVMVLWEKRFPRRPTSIPFTRWVNNMALMVIYTVLIRLVIPVATIDVAGVVHEQGWGILNLIELPFAVSVAIALITLDFIIWLQHVVFHAVPWLWRLHRVHHADLHYDATTGIRFHPLEILLSVGIKFGAIALLGAPVIAVVIFEVLLNATSLFNHGNIALPRGCDRLLRWVIVTPDMHRVHHSIDVHESNRNFGFNTPWWDRLFGTYQDQPKLGHQEMTIGILEYRRPHDVVSLGGLLRLPLRPLTPDTTRYCAIASSKNSL
ncbi:MAG: sterol desaturase family protein [Leptolyngbyaceae bacterium]|nr:sterol desaturase family protein [Leptolyngbyaceae bacterium]